MTGTELELLEREPPRPGTDPADVLLGLARIGIGMWWRTASWSVGTSLRVLRAAGDPRAASELAVELSDTLRGYGREFLGIADLDERLRGMMPTGRRGDEEEPANSVGGIEALRAQGAELLRQSADVNIEDAVHPAYARILEELAPDEARMLRLLYVEGPQAAVDVRSVQLLGLGSQLAAEGLTMIGAQAGCRHPERVAAYLNNLNRLGLVWFSKEPLTDSIAYQVLEAQPAVLGAIKGSQRAKTVQRSIRLTPFGSDFCEACLPVAALS